MAEIMPFVFMGVGAAALVRGLFRAHRSVLREGSVSRCAGPNSFKVCDPTLAIDAPDGTGAYATASGRVIALGDDFVQIRASNEPVIIMYQGIVPSVKLGQYVGRGQPLGKSKGTVYFGVWQMAPGPVMERVPASAWLASRGMRVVDHNTGAANKWCEGGRHIAVPEPVVQSCGFKQPDQASFAFLPVEISLG